MTKRLRGADGFTAEVSVPGTPPALKIISWILPSRYLILLVKKRFFSNCGGCYGWSPWRRSMKAGLVVPLHSVRKDCSVSVTSHAMRSGFPPVSPIQRRNFEAATTHIRRTLLRREHVDILSTVNHRYGIPTTRSTTSWRRRRGSWQLRLGDSPQSRSPLGFWTTNSQRLQVLCRSVQYQTMSGPWS